MRICINNFSSVNLIDLIMEIICIITWLFNVSVLEFLATTTTRLLWYMQLLPWYIKLVVTPPTPIHGVYYNKVTFRKKLQILSMLLLPSNQISASEWRKSVTNSAALIFTMSAWLNGNSINHSVLPSVQHISVLKSQGKKKKEMRNYGITDIFGFGITELGRVQMVRWNREARKGCKRKDTEINK